jgi:two-component system, cell cycle response regulator DivK
MHDEHILVVDDDPMSVKLIRALLTGEGYSVRSAKSAEEALEVLKDFAPQLILIDIQLPGVDGLELASQLRSNPAMRNTSIVALTGYAMKGDEHKAQSAGCDGYITKPIDVRTLPSVVGKFLKAENSQEKPPANGDNEDLLAELRNNLLAEGMDEVPKLLENLEIEFNVDKARRFFHRWAGVAGTLSCPEITRQAQNLEELLTHPVNETKETLRAGIQELMACFSQMAFTKKPDRVWPPRIVSCLSGKRLALIGFSPAEAQRIVHALQQTQASTRTFTRSLPGAEILSIFDMLVVKLSAPGLDSWTDPKQLENNTKPLLLIGSCEALLGASAIRGQPHDFLTPPWDAEEIILRVYRVLSKSLSRRAAASRRPGASLPVVVIADDDPDITRLVSATLEKFQVDCHVACDGVQALQMVKDLRPSALVLDINMPGLDGFDVLMRMRSDVHSRHIPVILLTGRQQEDDVMRGFGYGAADYVIKPFNPTELAARVSRLID